MSKTGKMSSHGELDLLNSDTKNINAILCSAQSIKGQVCNIWRSYLEWLHDTLNCVGLECGHRPHSSSLVYYWFHPYYKTVGQLDWHLQASLEIIWQLTGSKSLDSSMLKCFYQVKKKPKLLLYCWDYALLLIICRQHYRPNSQSQILHTEPWNT